MGQFGDRSAEARAVMSSPWRFRLRAARAKSRNGGEHDQRARPAGCGFARLVRQYWAMGDVRDCYRCGRLGRLGRNAVALVPRTTSSHAIQDRWIEGRGR
jgi:hypothetical protein